MGDSYDHKKGTLEHESCKIAICDDCAADVRYLSALTADWAKAQGRPVEVREFPSAEAFLFCYETEKDFDILLLDIEMGEISGMELARRLRRDNGSAQIVFVTGFPDFMAEGYDVSALHYLLKPVSPERLSEVLDRAAANLSRTEKRLRVVFDRQVNLVPFDRILYVEAQKQYVLIHTQNEEYRMKASLGEVQEELDGRFFRCQRSFLVNLCHVERIGTRFVTLRNGEEVPISRGAAEAIGKAIIKLF